MIRSSTLILACAALLAPAACGDASTHAGDDALGGKLVLTGSSTMAPLIREIARRFEADHPGVRVDVQTGGSSRGVADTRRGLADGGMSSRELADSERSGMASHTLARDGVAMLVHADNPVADLTEEQVRGIFTGRITRWTSVGGHDAPITVVNRAEGRSELDILCARLGLEPADMQADLVSGENQHGIKTVAGDRDAITYMSVGATEFAMRSGEAVKLVAWNGIQPSFETVATGAFPLSRPLILVTPDTPPALTQAFIDFALSEQSHDLIREFFYVPAR